MKNERKTSWEKPFGIASILICITIFLCERAGLIGGWPPILIMVLLLIGCVFAWVSDNKKLKIKPQEECRENDFKVERAKREKKFCVKYRPVWSNPPSPSDPCLLTVISIELMASDENQAVLFGYSFLHSLGRTYDVISVTEIDKESEG